MNWRMQWRWDEMVGGEEGRIMFIHTDSSRVCVNVELSCAFLSFSLSRCEIFVLGNGLYLPLLECSVFASHPLSALGLSVSFFVALFFVFFSVFFFFGWLMEVYIGVWIGLFWVEVCFARVEFLSCCWSWFSCFWFSWHSLVLWRPEKNPPPWSLFNVAALLPALPNGGFRSQRSASHTPLYELKLPRFDWACQVDWFELRHSAFKLDQNLSAHGCASSVLVQKGSKRWLSAVFISWEEVRYMWKSLKCQP